MIKRAARPYAQALYETARKQSDVADTERALQALAQAVTEIPELPRFFVNPAVPLERKLTALTELNSTIAATPLAARFAEVVVRGYRLGILPDIMSGYAEISRRARGVRRVEVTAAATLDAPQTAQLESALAGMLGGKVEMEVASDPALLGGFVARVGSRIYDASVRGQLERIRKELT